MPTIRPITDLTTPRPLRAALLATSLGVAALAGCYEDPQVKMDQAQQMTDMVDVVNELNARTSELAFTLDSLRNIVVKQDSTIWRLANLAGVPYQR
jgi:outer membrane murein-binding lipoprotein Lpp